MTSTMCPVGFGGGGGVGVRVATPDGGVFGGGFIKFGKDFVH